MENIWYLKAYYFNNKVIICQQSMVHAKFVSQYHDDVTIW